MNRPDAFFRTLHALFCFSLEIGAKINTKNEHMSKVPSEGGKPVALKIAIFFVVLIPTLIAILLFVIARLILADPALLTGGLQRPIIIACVISGIILLIPFLISGGLLLFRRKGKKGDDANHEPTDVTCT